ncbi:MAG: hypothetical protein ACRDLN_01640 [Solirubrobacteraceae bacterium]
MDDELLARHAALVGVVLAGEHERRLDLLAIDQDGGGVGVLLDDREDVGQQAALEVGEVGAVDGRVAAGADGVDRRAARGDNPLPGRSPYAALAVTSLRNLRPSS